MRKRELFGYALIIGSCIGYVEYRINTIEGITEKNYNQIRQEYQQKEKEHMQDREIQFEKKERTFWNRMGMLDQKVGEWLKKF